MKKKEKGAPASGPQDRIADPLRRSWRPPQGATRRGGQPGNHNAVKHGYYSSVFRQAERRLLEQVPLTDLSAEIELIRVTSKRFLQALAASKNDLDFETQLTALRAVNLSAQSIATLLRAHALTAALDRDAEDLLGDLEDLPDEEDSTQP